tara:strand:- start:208 stop:411 length:204 start_codon:yes stop_codon:yes gene_type:complete
MDMSDFFVTEGIKKESAKLHPVGDFIFYTALENKLPTKFVCPFHLLVLFSKKFWTELKTLSKPVFYG